MTAGEIASPDDVVVERLVDASPDAIVDHLTDFALEYGLQLDRRHDGASMRFVRKPDAPVQATELFRTGDAVVVSVTPDPTGHLVTCVATMHGLHQRGDDWKRGRAIRGTLLSGLFVWLGARGLAHPDVGDAVMFGLGGMFAMRTFRAVNHEEVDRAAFEDDVHRALAELCDRIEAAEE